MRLIALGLFIWLATEVVNGVDHYDITIKNKITDKEYSYVYNKANDQTNSQL